MTYDIFDKGYAITLVRSDGEIAHLQGEDATYFRDEFHQCDPEWTVTDYIKAVGYDMLFEEA